MIEEIQSDCIETVANKSKPNKYGKLNTQSYLTVNLINSSNINLETSRQCRICLQDDEVEQNRIISPCGCTGSVRFIHQKCFSSWVQKQYEKKNFVEKRNMMKEGIKCELCYAYVAISYDQQTQYCDKEYFEKTFAQSKAQFILTILACFILLAPIIYIVIYITENSLNFHEFVVQSITILSSLVLLIVILVTFIVILVKSYTAKCVPVITFDKNASNNKRIRNHLVVYPSSIIEQMN